MHGCGDIMPGEEVFASLPPAHSQSCLISTLNWNSCLPVKTIGETLMGEGKGLGGCVCFKG